MTTTFDTFLLAGQHPGAGRTRAITYALAAALHGAALVGAIVQGSWRVDEVKPVTHPVFITSRLPPAGAPPAAAPARPKTATTPKVKRRVAALTQPTQVKDPQPATTASATSNPLAEDLPGDPNAQDDGRGRDGGGGGNGNHFVAPNVAVGQLAIDPHAEPYRVKLPPALSRAGLQLWALVRVCVSRDGGVDDVRVLKGADPMVDPLIVATLRTWRYRPYQVNGRPVPFCTNVRYVMSAQ